MKNTTDGGRIIFEEEELPENISTDEAIREYLHNIGYHGLKLYLRPMFIALMDQAQTIREIKNLPDCLMVCEDTLKLIRVLERSQEPKVDPGYSHEEYLNV